jgi:lysophospholipase L1-like esterase
VVIISGAVAVNLTSALVTALRVERVLLLLSAIMCITILHPSRGFAQTCRGQEFTTTPSPPPNQRSYELCLRQLHSAVSADVDLILLGDSLAECWDNRMFLPINVVNLGVGGDKIQNVLWRLDAEEWSKLRPRAVLIMLGTNNLPENDACAIVAGLKKVVERVTSIWPLAHVVLLEITPRGRRFLDYNSSRVEINAAMHNVPGIKTVNVDDEITCGWEQQGASGPCPNYTDDYLHFSAAGYEIIRKHLENEKLGPFSH